MGLYQSECHIDVDAGCVAVGVDDMKLVDQLPGHISIQSRHADFQFDLNAEPGWNSDIARSALELS